MESYPDSIDITVAELFATSTLLGGEVVAGVENLLTDPLVSREQVFLSGLGSLAERGLVVAGTVEDDQAIDPSGDETAEAIGLEPVLAFMVLTLIEPDATFILSRFNDVTGENLDVSFHLQDSRAVMMTQHGADGFNLTPLDGAIDVQDMIEAIWNFASMDEDDFLQLIEASPESRVQGQLFALRQSDAGLRYRALAVYRDFAGLWCAERSSEDSDESAFALLEDVDLWDRINDIMTLTVYPGANIEEAMV